MKKNDVPPLFNKKDNHRTEKIITAIEQLWNKTSNMEDVVDITKKYLDGSIDLAQVKVKLTELEDYTEHLDSVKLENPVDCILFNTDYTGSSTEGCIHWNTDEGCLEVGMPGGNCNLQIGMEILLPRRVKNVSGVDIKNGNVVYTGQGFATTAEVALSKADNFLTSLVSGLATEDIDNGQTGWVTTYGIVRGDSDQPINTSSYSTGEFLYLSATTAGAWTNVIPSAPNNKIFIGRVWRSHAVEGEIFVLPIATQHIARMSDMNETAAVDKSIIQWNDSNSYYEHTTTPQFGDPSGGDYSEFESNGTIVFNGDATVWEDLNFDVVRSGGPVATRPDDVTINNVYYKEFTSANNQTSGAEEEIPHNAKLGENFYPHAHGFLKSGESSGTTGVTFRIYWELRQSTGTTNGYVDISKTSAELAANGNKIDFFGAYFTGSTELGAQLALRLDRISGDAGDIIITTFGIHYKLDMVGSREITTK